METRMMRKCLGLVAVLMALVSPVSSNAQATLAELRGTVTDESGAVLPGATVTASHTETGTSRTTDRKSVV